MGSILSFCNKTSPPQTLDKQEQAIMDCKICRDKIKSYIKRLEKQEATKRNQAKLELKNNNRDKAKRLLNQSKIFNEQQKVANGQLNMIQDQIIQIENAQIKKDALIVLQQGNAVLQKLNEEVSLEKWEKISDDLNDFKSQQNEISDFLNNRGIDQEAFDDEINNELAGLEKYILNENKSIEAELPSLTKKADIGNINIKGKNLNNDERIAIEN
jgi:charged multivesicular body protein 6